MRIVPIDRFIAGLCSITEERFDVDTVFDYLKTNPVDSSSVNKYLFFSKKHYTRNLIFKNHLFELLTICWEVGQVSPIHNHQDQNCWMVMPMGRLRVQNFQLVEQSVVARKCRLNPTERFEVDSLMPTKVDLHAPVHQVLNPAEFKKRAVSLHIYSKPFDRCLVYSLAKSKYEEVSLHYSSEYGQLCEGVEL